MSPLRRSVLALTGALPIPVILVYAVTRHAFVSGTPPFDPDWPVYSILGGLSIGVAAIAQLPLRGTLKRLVVLVIYVPLWSIVLWAVSYMTGCFSGFC
jgi:hypothetical protein